LLVSTDNVLITHYHLTMNKFKMFTLVAMFGLVLMGGSSVALAAEPVATSTPHSTTSTTPLYFFNALGIHTTMEAASAVWKDAAIRKFIMEEWRFRVFGYRN